MSTMSRISGSTHSVSAHTSASIQLWQLLALSNRMFLTILRHTFATGINSTTQAGLGLLKSAAWDLIMNKMNDDFIISCV